MKILMVNKFLFPKGGAETYVLRLGAALQAQGHEVQYFGMDHPARIVGNRAEAYTAPMDFHGASKLVRLTYPLRILYSAEAARKIRRVLDQFCPDVCHLNNFNYQLTPSIIRTIRRWEKETGRRCRILYTAHDPQLVCPNHLCRNPNTGELCQKCLQGRYWACIKGRCIHGSFARSVLGALESALWHAAGTYREIETVVCCSHSVKRLLDTDTVLAEKTVVLHNFWDGPAAKEVQKKDYVLYFGRYAGEKGVETLVRAAKELPHIPFVFAGSGPLESLLQQVPNIRNVGFQTGEALAKLIAEARFSVLPSQWYENCPYSVLESVGLGTPVLGADIGGIPELIRPGVTGELFESGNTRQLRDTIAALWGDAETLARYTQNCVPDVFDKAGTYIEKIMRYYRP